MNSHFVFVVFNPVSKLDRADDFINCRDSLKAPTDLFRQEALRYFDLRLNDEAP